MSDRIWLGDAAKDLTYAEPYEPITQVIIHADNNVDFVAGDDTGRTLEFQCPWGNQSVADTVLSQVAGYAYQPMHVDTAFESDPLWELGDAISVHGVYSQIVAMPTTYGKAYYADIDAPDTRSVEHEYQYETKSERALKKSVAKTLAILQVSVDQILAKVEAEYETKEAAASILISAKQYSDTVVANIEMSVNNGQNVSTIRLSAEDLQINTNIVYVNQSLSIGGRPQEGVSDGSLGLGGYYNGLAWVPILDIKTHHTTSGNICSIQSQSHLAISAYIDMSVAGQNTTVSGQNVTISGPSVNIQSDDLHLTGTSSSDVCIFDNINSRYYWVLNDAGMYQIDKQTGRWVATFVLQYNPQP